MNEGIVKIVCNITDTSLCSAAVLTPPPLPFKEACYWISIQKQGNGRPTCITMISHRTQRIDVFLYTLNRTIGVGGSSFQSIVYPYLNNELRDLEE